MKMYSYTLDQKDRTKQEVARTILINTDSTNQIHVISKKRFRATRCEATHREGAQSVLRSLNIIAGIDVSQR